MLFSSIVFICFFLPVLLALYYAIPGFRNSILLFASLLFYAWGEMAFFPVLVASITFNWLIAILIQKSRHPAAFLSIGLVVNIAILAAFKYANFFSQNLYLLTGAYIPGASQLSRIPLGISFFTFQAISYLFDVYRRDTPVEKRFTSVALYISMFPQLVAGPIVRFKDIADEIHQRTLRLDRIASGARLFVLGLSSKVLIANTLAVPADAAFNLDLSQVGTDLAWFGLLCYTLQIYYDFAGYSWMAIGLGCMTGFTFPKNFNFPYSALSITDFWRRWHISLSTWFRDYLYIPLGGNRIGTFATYRNLAIVFLLCGFWHGANWTFVLWGFYHGVLLILERAFGIADGTNRLPAFIRRAYTLIAVAGGWLLFRSENLAQAREYLMNMFGMEHGAAVQRTAFEYLSPDVILVLAIAISLSGVLGRIRPVDFEVRFERLLPAIHMAKSFGMAILLAFCLAALASGTHNPFIYFNF